MRPFESHDSAAGQSNNLLEKNIKKKKKFPDEYNIQTNSKGGRKTPVGRSGYA